MKKPLPKSLRGSRPDLMDGPAWPPLWKKPPTRKQLDGMAQTMMQIYLATKATERSTAKDLSTDSTSSTPPVSSDPSAAIAPPSRDSQK